MRIVLFAGAYYFNNYLPKSFVAVHNYISLIIFVVALRLLLRLLLLPQIVVACSAAPLA